jgi:hypothetical protein
MAKVSAKNGIILIGGHNQSVWSASYDIDYSSDIIDVTGFAETWHNFIPGEHLGQMSINMFWDKDEYGFTDLKPLGAKCVTVMPEGYALGNPCFTMQAINANYTPSGAAGGAIMIGNIVFQGNGVDAGPLPAVALAHELITNTSTGTGFVDASGGAVTQRCAGVLHVWDLCATDTYVVKIQHCATIGGVYADLITFTLNGSAFGSEKVAVASGVIQPYRRVLATRTGAAGDSFGYSVAFWHAGM